MALLVVPALEPVALSLLPAYPLVSFFAGALLAWRFRRWRVLVATLSLAAAERALAAGLGSWIPFAHVVLAATSAALPLNLTALTWLPERARAVFAGSAVLVAAEALAAGLLMQPEAAPVADVLARPLGDGRLPMIGIFAFAGVATPSQDPLTMLALAVPMVVLYGAALGIAFLHDRRAARKTAESWSHLGDDELSPLDVMPVR